MQKENIAEDSMIDSEFDEYHRKRIDIFLTYFRGDTFFMNLQKLITSPQAMKNLEILNERNCELRSDDVSYRTLHHWDSINLLECERASTSGWRKFNYIEILWVQVITQFRKMGVSLDKISKAKSYFFEKIPDCDLKFAQYYFIGALYFQQPTYFITTSKGQSEFLAYHEMVSAMHFGALDNCIMIHLNPLLNQIFKKIEIKSKFPDERLLTDEQSQIFDLMSEEEFETFKIFKSGGKISAVEIQKGFSPETSYSEIRNGEINATICTKITGGVVTSKSRTKKVKIK